MASPKDWPDSARISYEQENPKQSGGASHARYEKYKVAKTLGEARELGAWKGDLINDFQKGYLKKLESSAASSSSSRTGSGAKSKAASSAQEPASKKSKSAGNGKAESKEKKQDAGSKNVASKAKAEKGQKGTKLRACAKKVGAKVKVEKDDPAEAKPESSDGLKVGSRMQCTKLVSSAELNGTYCKLKSFDAERGRWTVELEKDKSCRQLKPENLEPVGTTKAKVISKISKVPVSRISKDERAFRLFRSSQPRQIGRFLHLSEVEKKKQLDKREKELRESWEKCEKKTKQQFIKRAEERYAKELEGRRKREERGPAFTAYSTQLALQRKKFRLKDLPTMRKAVPTWTFPQRLPKLLKMPARLGDPITGEGYEDDDADDEDDSNVETARKVSVARTRTHLAELRIDAIHPVEMAAAALPIFRDLAGKARSYWFNLSFILAKMADPILNLAEHVDPSISRPSNALTNILGSSNTAKGPQDGTGLSKHLFSKSNEYPPQIEQLVKSVVDSTRSDLFEQRTTLTGKLRQYEKKLRDMSRSISSLTNAASSRHNLSDLCQRLNSIWKSITKLDLEVPTLSAAEKQDAKMKTFRKDMTEAGKSRSELQALHAQQTSMWTEIVARKMELDPHTWAEFESAFFAPDDVAIESETKNCLGEYRRIGIQGYEQTSSTAIRALAQVEPSTLFAHIGEQQLEWHELQDDILKLAATPNGIRDIVKCGKQWKNIQNELSGHLVTTEYMSWMKRGCPAHAECKPFGKNQSGTNWFCELCQSWESSWSLSTHMACGVLGGKPRTFTMSTGDSFGLEFQYSKGEDGKVTVQMSATFAQLLARLAWTSFWPADQIKASFRLVQHVLPVASDQSSQSPASLTRASSSSSSWGVDSFPREVGAKRHCGSSSRQRLGYENPLEEDDDEGPQFSLASCADMEGAAQPIGFQIPLFPVQTRTLAWMKDRENQPLEYLSREVIRRPFLGCNVDVELRVDRHWNAVRGGILADSVGYGKTACMIGLIDSDYRKPMTQILSSAEFESLSKRFILSNATLVITPPNLFEQWLGEFKKFLKPDDFEYFKIIEIPHIHRLNKLSVEDLANAEVVIVPYRFFFSGVYDKYMDETIGRNANEDSSKDTKKQEESSKKGKDEEKAETKDKKKKKEKKLSWRQRRAERLKARKDKLKKKSKRAKIKTKAPVKEDMGKYAQTLRYDILRKFVAQMLQQCQSQSSASSSSSDSTVRCTSAGQALPVNILERMAPTLEAFFWRRVVFDEFHEVLSIREGRPYHALRQCFAKFHWGLTATPRLGGSQDVSDMASLLHISIPPQSFQEAEHFLAEWVRSSTWDTSSVPLESRIITVKHTKQERLLYLHQRNSVNNQGGGRTNREAEEHLLQLCSHFSESGALAEEDVINPESAVVKRRTALHKELEEVRTELSAAEAELPGLKRRWKAVTELRNVFIDLGLPSGAAAKGADLAVGDAYRLSGDLGAEDLEKHVALLRTYCPKVEANEGDAPKAAESNADAATSSSSSSTKEADSSVGQPAELPSERPVAPQAKEVKLTPALKKALEPLAVIAGRIKNAGQRYKPKLIPHGREIESTCLHLASAIERDQKRIDGLEKSIRFFENTFKVLEEEKSVECPICMEDADPSRCAITACGHLFHDECIRMVVQAHKHCPTCRSALGSKDVNLVQQVLADNRGDDTVLEEGTAPEYGSKMAKIVETLREVRKEEKGAKIIMFCQWERILKFMAKTLVQLGEPPPLVLRGQMSQRQSTIRDFVDSSDPRHSVLLLSLEKSPTGMNLVSCHHLFLVHPMYAQTKERAVAFELQAIGRLRRQGQKNKVIVHRFVTHGTIEEEITKRHQTHLEQVNCNQQQSASPSNAKGKETDTKAKSKSVQKNAKAKNANCEKTPEKEKEEDSEHRGDSEVQAALRSGF